MAFTDEQRRNAAIIAQVGREVGASERDIQIAIMVAFQESTLRNLNYGDRDSQGLFQQRPSMGWGSVSQITDPRYSARAFFLGAGTNKGLLDYDERDSWSLTQAAQQVQRSAFPDAYAKWEDEALSILSEAAGIEVGSSTPTTVTEGNQSAPLDMFSPEQGRPGQQANSLAPGVAAVTAPGTEAAGVSAMDTPGVAGVDKPMVLPASEPFLPELDEETFNQLMSSAASGKASGRAQDIIDFAKQFVGTPYQWGGAGPLGFDCSGLLQYAFAEFGIDLPRVSFQQANGGKRVDAGSAQAGDLWWIDNSSRNNGADHIALYLGNGQILEAPRAGLDVRIRDLTDDELKSGGFTRYL